MKYWEFNPDHSFRTKNALASGWSMERRKWRKFQPFQWFTQFIPLTSIIICMLFHTLLSLSIMIGPAVEWTAHNESKVFILLLPFFISAEDLELKPNPIDSYCNKKWSERFDLLHYRLLSLLWGYWIWSNRFHSALFWLPNHNSDCKI